MNFNSNPFLSAINNIRKNISISYDKKKELIESLKTVIGYKKTIKNKSFSEDINANLINNLNQNSYYPSFEKTNQKMQKYNNHLLEDDMQSLKEINYSRIIDNKGNMIHKIDDASFVVLNMPQKLTHQDITVGNISSLEYLPSQKKFKDWIDKSGIIFDEGAFSNVKCFFDVCQSIAKLLHIDHIIDRDFFEDKNNKIDIQKIAKAIRIIIGSDICMPYHTKGSVLSTLDSYVNVSETDRYINDRKNTHIYPIISVSDKNLEM